jgi:hypothetical protein
MRTLLLIVMVVLPLQKPQTKADATQHATQTDQRGTSGTPFVVKINPTPKTDEEATQDKKDREEKTANDRNLVTLTGILAVVGALQLFVFGYQAIKLKETVKSSSEQSAAMERHIGEVTRSADAMEKIVSTIEQGNRDALRAYLTVTIGTAVYQERREGQGDLKFEVKPNLVNTGSTPARKVCIRIAADILPEPPPEDFTFPLSEANFKDSGIVGAHHTYILSGTVPDFVPDSEVPIIKEGKNKVLCVWGLVTYEDIFGNPHNTRFGQWITWWPNGTVFGYYIPGQNDAD